MFGSESLILMRSKVVKVSGPIQDLMLSTRSENMAHLYCTSSVAPFSKVMSTSSASDCSIFGQNIKCCILLLNLMLTRCWPAILCIDWMWSMLISLLCVIIRSYGRAEYPFSYLNCNIFYRSYLIAGACAPFLSSLPSSCTVTVSPSVPFICTLLHLASVLNSLTLPLMFACLTTIQYVDFTQPMT